MRLSRAPDAQLSAQVSLRLHSLPGVWVRGVGEGGSPLPWQPPAGFLCCHCLYQVLWSSKLNYGSPKGERWLRAGSVVLRLEGDRNLEFEAQGYQQGEPAQVSERQLETHHPQRDWGALFKSNQPPPVSGLSPLPGCWLLILDLGCHSCHAAPLSVSSSLHLPPQSRLTLVEGNALPIWQRCLMSIGKTAACRPNAAHVCVLFV